MLRWLTGLAVALRSIVRRNRIENELDEEIQYHLERQIAEGLNAGLTPEEARYAALRAMGAIDKSKEECRDVRSANLLSDVAADLRYAARTARRSPGFAALAVGIMALGIGANTAVFSVVNAVLLTPPPYPEPDRLVTFSTVSSTTGDVLFPQVSMGDFRDWRAQSVSFDAMATYYAWEAPVRPGGTAEYARVARVNPDFFDVLGVRPAIGRTFVLDELVPGNQAVLISHAYWQTRFGGDPGVLQRTIRVYDETWPIVGVLPPGFEYPGETDVWFPEADMTESRSGLNFRAIARLKPATPLEQAQAEMSTLAARLEQDYPETNEGRGVGLTRLHDAEVGDVGLTLYLLWGVVSIVLLIACANTSTLLLGRATARTREVAVRAPRRAARRRIVRQLITESLLLALAAGAVGMAVAYGGVKALVALAPAGLLPDAATGIDGGVLAFTLGVSLATGLVFGLVPALHASKVDLLEALRQGGTRSVLGGGIVRARSVLVVAEIALAVVLLTGAGLLMKSLVRLHLVELGFQPENVLVMKATGIATIRENNAFFTELFPRIAALPGVVAVGATSTPPGDMSLAGGGSYFIDRRPEPPHSSPPPQALVSIVAPGSFAALGIPMTSGRDFDAADIVNRPLVAIVNEALVRQSFGNENPIGRTIFCSWDRDDGMTIVGVVGDVRQRGPAVAPSPVCYLPYRQHVYNNNTLNVVIRTANDPTALAATVQRLAAEVSPDVPVSFTTMDATLSGNLSEPRFRALLFGIFAALAICLTMAGVYGVMAYVVQQRASEIGLRLALGASKTTVLRLVLGQGLGLTAVGLVLGLIAAGALTRFLVSVLFEVQPLDAPVYLGVIALLAAVTLMAGYVPARRVAAVDPMTVLNGD